MDSTFRCVVDLGSTTNQTGSDANNRLKTTFSVSVATMVVAGGLGPAAAQEATQLPSLEVTASKPKKKAPARTAQPAPRAPVPQTPAPVLPPPDLVPLEAPGVGPSNSDTMAVTPGSGNTLQSGTGLGRLPGLVQSLPQTVNVVPEKIIEEQNITTLSQALRNVPGVTVNLGEGGAGMNGDQFRIRGFQAKGDMYVDGLRDFGVYVRDMFAVQEVQVIKGPSAESFGMGTAGGAINMRLKEAHLGDETMVEGVGGMGPMYRAVADVNKQLGQHSGIRLVGMFHDQEFVDRDLVFSDRYGFFGSLAMGLNTETNLTLSYLFQHGDRLPDQGVPFANPSLQNAYPYKIGLPVTEFGANRANFYGKKSDVDDHNIHMFTARFSSNVNPWLTVYNDSRLAYYDRLFSHSFANCDAVGDGGTTQLCSQNVFDRMLNTPYRLSQNGFDQETWGGQNITTGVAKFNTGPFRHELVGGLDLFFQEDRRYALTQGPATAGTIANPDNSGGWDSINLLSHKRGRSDDVAFFVSDRLWLTEKWSILGGARWDDFSAEFYSTTTGVFGPPLKSDTDFVSPKASVIFEPTKYQTYYGSYAKSYSTLAGQFISNDNNGISDESLEPEENVLWEIGAKISTRDGRLGMTAALFRIDKDNPFVIDPVSGDVVPLGDTQKFRVQGFEFGLTGQITEAWGMQLAYAYLDSEVLYNAALPNADPAAAVLENQYKGNKVPFVSPNNFSIWTTYELSKLIQVGPGKLLVGGGVIANDEYFTHARNGSIVPSYFALDALVSYEVNDWRFAANGYNLTDELNYDAAQFNNSPGPSRGMRGRALPAPGTTVLFTVGKKF